MLQGDRRMRKLTWIFIVALIAIGLADLIQCLILTFFYQPHPYITNNVELANLLKYSITAITVTICLFIAFKLKNLINNYKSKVKV